MYVGSLGISEARVALFAEFLDRQGSWFGEDTPAAGEDPVALIRAGINEYAIGFRLYTRGTGVMRVGDEGFRMATTERIEQGPVHRIGRLVSLQYAERFLATAAGTVETAALRRLIKEARAFKAFRPRLLRYSGDWFVFVPDDVVVVDEKGLPVKNVLNAPVSP